jgi:hypothetical protein
MAKASKAAGAKAKTTASRGKRGTADKASAFPKMLVRVTLGPGNSPVADSVMVTSAEAEKSMGEQGYKPLDDAIADQPKQAYPAWRYSADGDRRIVNSEEEEEALEGTWSDSPTEVEQPDQTDLARAEHTLGPGLARKLNMLSNQQLGIRDAAVKADGNFDPSTVIIGKGENPDAKVQASRSTEPARSGARR